MTWMSKKPFMIFLSLKHINQIPPLNRNASNIINFIFSFFLMIRRIWDFKILLIPLIIDTHKSKLRKAMLKTYTIQSNAPDLNSDGTLSWPSGINL